jgi:hypothetical protein
MARQNNFLLGNGERLTQPVQVPSGGGDKNPPYDFTRARKRLSTKLKETTKAFESVPADACPGGEVVAVVTMHPRYISKSDFPEQLLKTVGVRAVGSRSTTVTPEAWGVKKHRESAVTQQIFVAGEKEAFDTWAAGIGKWQETHDGANELGHIEDISAFSPDDKLRSIPRDRESVTLEVVLHNDQPGNILKTFAAYAELHGAQALLERARSVQGLTFVPVKASPKRARELAQFSFVRVARGMPSLRPVQPTFIRGFAAKGVVLPDADATGGAKAVIFDGGLPTKHALTRWARAIDPPGIGAPVPSLQHHGLAVTGALLFGHLDGNAIAPFCTVDHVRVLDDRSGKDADLEIIDALDRIVAHLLDHADDYRYLNLSLGPALAIDDDEVTVWTATMDDLLSRLNLVATAAVGNDGELDATSGLNRLQPPSDGVNILAVGACDSVGVSWKRAPYSCIGPGRSPGYMKPDGVEFGGSTNEPFLALSSNGTGPQLIEVVGTSLASPLALRTVAAVDAALDLTLTPLTLRALMIHRADRAGHAAAEVGWGRFESDIAQMITCEDREAIVVFQGELPVGEHLRAPLPLPKGPLTGDITISSTLLIAPEVDPEHAAAYTRSGLEISFRPDSRKFHDYEDGRQSAHAKTKPFFSRKNMYGAAEMDAREDGHKWEPCRKNSKKYRSSSLHEPCFDIYYHHREGTTKAKDPQPIPYALIVGISASKMTDFYARVVRTYAHQLVQLRPKIQIQVRAS